MAPESAGFDLAKVIHYPLPHYEVEIMGLVQPLVERGNVEIVGIEEDAPQIRAWVHPPSLNGNKAQQRSGSTGCNTLGHRGNLVVSVCFSGSNLRLNSTMKVFTDHPTMAGQNFKAKASRDTRKRTHCSTCSHV